MHVERIGRFGPVALVVALLAGPVAPAAAANSATALFKRVWGYATLYDDPQGRLLRKVALKGRFQLDMPVFDSNRGDYSEFQVRRFRIGFKSEWRSDLIVHLEANLDLTCEQDEVCEDDAYEELTEA